MIIPRNGDFIKHQASMDVAIKIDKVLVFEHKVKVKGVWWNQGFVDSFCMGMPVRFEIKTRHLHNWLICDNPIAQCIRGEKWLPIK